MSKLISILVAAIFTISSGLALAASHAGAPMKDEKKSEMKKGDKKPAKKAAKKEAKKDEMKK